MNEYGSLAMLFMAVFYLLMKTEPRGAEWFLVVAIAVFGIRCAILAFAK
jgi:hypothetical protein